MRISRLCALALAGALLTIGSPPIGRATPASANATHSSHSTPAESAPPAESHFAVAVSGLQSLPGQVGLLVIRDGRALAAHNESTPLAVASASRLAIMAALKKAYAAGSLKPATVVPLQAGDMASFGGVMQNWPVDTPVTVATAAALMSQIADNTAADLLMRVLGREAVGAEAPQRDRPYLTPREMSVLKATGNSTFADSWKAASTPTARARLLSEIDAQPLPGREALGPEPHQTAIEWFYTPQELCTLMDGVADMPEMSINPVLVVNGWKHVAFAGGEEPGVIDMTYQLVANDGTRYCVTATWNDDKELGEYKFTRFVAQLIDALPH